MNKAWAFLLRDYRIHRTYRLLFAMEALSLVVNIVPFYFLSRFVGEALEGDLRQFGGDYFSYMFIGLAVNDYLILPLSLFSRHIRESQLNGTLEAVLSTQTSLYTVLLSSALYPLIWASIKGATYVVLGITVFGMRFGNANWPAAAFILILSLMVFAGIGILSASFILVFKQGDPLTFLISGMSWVFAGIIYPVSILPEPLQLVSAVIPIRHAIDGMRAAVLQDASWAQIMPNLATLGFFVALVLPIGLAAFYYANRRVRVTGSLADY